MVFASLLACLALAATAFAAADVTGTIRGASASSSPLRLQLNGGLMEATARKDGSFIFRAVPEGVYVLEVLSSSVVFPTVKVQVKGDDRVRAISFDFPGAPHKAMMHPLRLQPLAEPVFFTPKPQPNLLGMLRNPQVLLMGGMLVMTMLMPSGPQSKEQKEDQKRQMKELGFNGNPGDIQSMMAGLMGKGGAAADSDDED